MVALSSSSERVAVNGVALITGAGRGIGRAIALALGRSGVDISVGYRTNASAASAVVAELETMGRRAIALAGDVGEATVCGRLVEDTVARLGRIDILVANAGGASFAPFLSTDLETYELQLRTNARSSFLLAQAAARHMIDQGEGGRIIFVTSEAADLAVEGMATYCASKAAQKMIMKCAAVELAPHGITVNAVAPGTIETDVNRDLLADAEMRTVLLGRVLLDHRGTPDDVADAAIYLAGAAHVTGSTISVNGGSLML